MMRRHSRVGGILVALVTLLCAARAQAQLTFTTAPTGLMASYGMSNGVDWSGNNRTAALTNTTVAPGKYGSAQRFNGASSRMTIPTFAVTTAFTLEAWVFLDAVTGTRAVAAPRGTTSTWQAIIYKGSDNFFLVEVGGFYMAGLTTAAGVVQVVNPTKTAAVSWHHVAAVYDGATLRLYIDGLMNASQAVTGPIVASPQPIEIGGSAVDLGFLGGLVDDARIYSRALTAAEVASDMATPVDTVREPVASWDLEIWPKGTIIPPTGSPSNGALGLMNFVKAGALCNLAPIPPPVGTVSNPSKARLTDPELPTRECELVIQSFIATIPVGLGYLATARAKGAVTSSERSGPSNPFDRIAEVTPPLPAGPPSLRRE